jgi:hypothetical protein
MKKNDEVKESKLNLKLKMKLKKLTLMPNLQRMKFTEKSSNDRKQVVNSFIKCKISGNLGVAVDTKRPDEKFECMFLGDMTCLKGIDEIFILI